MALLRATAGMWRSGDGRILRPDRTAFLPDLELDGSWRLSS
jgi:hypothetical protein